MIVAELLATYEINLPSTAPGQYQTTCPQCSPTRKKSKVKCLGVLIDDRGVCWNCGHCNWSGPEKGGGKDGNGRGGAQHAATYDYTGADGALLFQKVRNAPGQEPRFWLRRPDGKGGWITGTKGVNTGILYHAPGVSRASTEGRVVAVVEGEKDANSVRALGLIATCNAHGASELGKRPKWTRAHSEQLRGADIVVLNDNDPAGYAHADATCSLSLGVAKRVRRLDLAQHWPEIPKGGDVSDWLAGGHTREELAALIEAAPDYVPPVGAKETAPPPDAKAPASGSGTDDDAEIEKLAKMSAIDYDHARKAAAKRLDVRASILDKLVQAKRAELGLDGDDGKSGHAIEFPGIEPWPEPVNGAEVLDKIAEAIGAHVIMAEHSRDACALWAAHTFLTERTMISPRLAFTSPTKGCGKTTALDVMGQLVLRPLAAANVSPSAIFRVVEACHPTLLIDEADSFLKDNEELRGVLNSGHRRGGAVLRTVAVGDDFEVRSFATYGAMVIALIGQLPSTLADRSVSIVLTRRKHSEAVTPFRLDRVEHLVTLARKLTRWTKDNEEAIAAVEPEMPAGLYNRAADNWRPLLAIATVAGGDWLARGHKAALAGAGADVDEVSRLELLLGDFRDTVFPEVGLDEISSAKVIEKLVEITPRPWAEYGKGGKPITQNKLARLLAQAKLGIAPQQIRVGTDEAGKDIQVRGYRKVDFQEAFERFLLKEGGSNRHSVTNADETGTSSSFQSVTASKPCDTLESEGNPLATGLCDGVTVGKGGNGKNAREGAFEVVGRSTPGSRCLLCGKGGEVHLVRRWRERGLDHAHLACAEKAWGDPQPSATDAPPPANGGDGEAGVSARQIRRLADEYQDRAYANSRETGGDTRTADRDAWLRQKLADEGVRPEHIEVEFEWVMAMVFRV